MAYEHLVAGVSRTTTLCACCLRAWWDRVVYTTAVRDEELFGSRWYQRCAGKEQTGSMNFRTGVPGAAAEGSIAQGFQRGPRRVAMEKARSNSSSIQQRSSFSFNAMARVALSTFVALRL
jgi:hypothetical protein